MAPYTFFVVKHLKTHEMSNVLLLILALRVLNSFLTRTYFQADEFWQALEPAHFKAFGYGHLTWEWEHGLRSYAFPLLFELGYRSVKLLMIIQNHFLAAIAYIVDIIPLTTDWGSKLTYYADVYSTICEYYMVLYTPKIIMSAVAATGEYYTIKWIQKIYLLTMDKSSDSKAVERLPKLTQISVLLTLTNFFNCFIITRTFINSFEMCSTCVALFYWDWSGGVFIESKEFTTSLAIAMFTCLQRPSNGLIWLILGGYLILNLLFAGQTMKIAYLLRKVALVLISTVACNALIDYYFYGSFVLPVFRFLKFNLTTSLSSFYGVAPWHFHVAQSLPIILGYSIPLFAYGMLTPQTKKKFPHFWMNPYVQVKTVIVFNLVIYSLLQHKEFRFIYPLQPLFILISSVSAINILDRFKANQNKLKNLTYALSFISVLVACILNLLLEGGVISVVIDLHKGSDIHSIGFIMPCHSTPWQSHLHRNDINTLWSISCDPPLHLLDDSDAQNKLLLYMDRSDYLYENIPKFIHNNFPPLTSPLNEGLEKEFRYEWPQYLIIFEHLDDAFMKSFLQGTPYVQSTRYFNTFSHWDHRRRGDVIVYKRTDL